MNKNNCEDIFVITEDGPIVNKRYIKMVDVEAGCTSEWFIVLYTDQDVEVLHSTHPSYEKARDRMYELFNTK